ncbi:multiple sugar transport system permease protein [Amycolatopsis bartoniae]|uniref:ABC transporter permease n=1 Tax=Amycolatopsis bartoniae TaxID=941986 RepID=A0A8H9IR66_9PSEU|nr:carbohydrate ABC transporter permease [Amycolatopsis bartoniae]MBB2937845.1 multiple sugar transport system permease protein [Amycolatopsis bartoniae]TVT06495.1 carbohydrate ABC transporter permease [Amycolatopsis bartoniae]GHF41160.1 ABC transporter permease [Amycolatopsis bartoniae]
MRDSAAVRAVRVVVIVVLTVFVAVPLYVMLVSSVKPLRDVQGAFTVWPSKFTLQPFVDMWRTVPLAQYFVNSAVISLGASVLSVLIAIVAAYALSRYRFRARTGFLGMVLSTQMLPGVLFLLPLFLIYVNLDRATGTSLFGSRFGLIVTYLTFALPFAIWLLVGYFDSIPRELDEAALVDGATPIGALVRVVLPAALPGVAAVTIYAFMTAWTEVLFASVLTTTETRTLAVGLRAYATQVDVYWNQVMAASLVVSVPVVVGFLLLQKALVRGLTAGAVKA